MAWFQRRGAGKDVGADQGVGGPADGEPETHASLGLQALLEDLPEDSSQRVLDLGPAIGSNLQFLSRYASNLAFVDLFGSVMSDPASLLRLESQPREVFSDLLTSTQDDLFDVILAWDLFNYLGRSQVAALAGELTRRCRTGGRLLALIRTSRVMPGRPVQFRILDGKSLAYEATTRNLQDSPRFAPAEVDNLLAGFHVDRSFLLRHGIQEYLMIRDES